MRRNQVNQRRKQESFVTMNGSRINMDQIRHSPTKSNDKVMIKEEQSDSSKGYSSS